MSHRFATVVALVLTVGATLAARELAVQDHAAAGQDAMNATIYPLSEIE